jgi:hypothetical protein
MKRILLPVLASALVGLFVPAVATARHHHGHARTHKSHARSARLLNFGAASLSGDPGSTTTPTQASPTNEQAGTVESFENGVLKIKLGDGSVVSGKVTADTELRCQSATPSGGSGDDQDENDDQDSQGEQQGVPSAPGGLGTQQGDFMAHAADGNGGDEGGAGNQSQETCTTAALTNPTPVLEAELELGSAGAVWEKVVIVH